MAPSDVALLGLWNWWLPRRAAHVLRIAPRPVALVEITATKRLRLRPLQADDLRAFVADRSHPDVARYQSWEPTYAMTDAEALLAAQAERSICDAGRMGAGCRA